jgi:hypothetical protein
MKKITWGGVIIEEGWRVQALLLSITHLSADTYVCSMVKNMYLRNDHRRSTTIVGLGFIYKFSMFGIFDSGVGGM